MEEDFDNVAYLWADNIGETVVLEEVYIRLLNAYKDLKERHQRLLDLAGSSYL